MFDWSTIYPFLTLAVGLFIVIFGIVSLKMNAFLALITAAMVVSIMAPGAWAEKTSRVAAAFGDTAAGIGIVIALAAVIGKAMMDSGAADRIVNMFLALLGEKRAASVLMASGFTLAIPVFFDTVFYLLVPLARSMYRHTGKHYVKYLLAVGTAAIAHTLIPPTPGPLFVADELGVDLGVMILMGVLVGAPAAVAGLMFSSWVDRRMPIEMRPLGAGITEPEPLPTEKLPNLAVSLAPIILPIALITANTVAKTAALPIVQTSLELFTGADAPRALGQIVVSLLAVDLAEASVNVTSLVGNPNFALLISAAIAVFTLVAQRRPTRDQLANTIEQALMSGGIIILITAAGGAFGGMLKEAGLAPAIQHIFGESSASGIPLLLLAFFISALLKFAQGSTTAAMIVTSGMFSAMVDPSALGFHPVYLAMVIGGGGLMGSWMNDSGFWIFARMGGLTEVETLKVWTPMLIVLGLVSTVMTIILAVVLPMPPT